MNPHSHWRFEEPARKTEGERVFFITGLPRFRGAWLANLFNWPPVWCCHELCRAGTWERMADILRHDGPLLPLMGGPGVEERDRVGAPLAFMAKGTADSGFLYYYPQALKTFPDARVAFIRRDIADVRKGVAKILARLNVGMDPERAIARLQEQMGKAMLALANNPNVITLDYDELDSDAEMDRLWRHCTGLYFPVTRYARLKDMRVERITERSAEILRDPEQMENLKTLFGNPTYE